MPQMFIKVLQEILQVKLKATCYTEKSTEMLLQLSTLVEVHKTALFNLH